MFEFRECSKNLDFVRKVQDDFESRVELVSTSKVKNLIARLRGLFKPERKQEKLEQLERERQEKKLEEANIHLIKYYMTIIYCFLLRIYKLWLHYRFEKENQCLFLFYECLLYQKQNRMSIKRLQKTYKVW